jgi:formate hydrogenlyase subunit 4
MSAAAPLDTLLALGLAPLLLGVINRTKAVIAGRVGQPLLQPYHDLAKLLRKGAVYSQTTTWVFRSAPVIGLAAVVVALVLVPFAGVSAPWSFPGDVILLAYLLGLMRFTMVLAALDTGSSFEGMGASREVTFAALAEPAVLLGLATLTRATGSMSLSGMFAGVTLTAWAHQAPALALVAGALVVVFLAENGRIPVDDPTTHLELTMIHEVMVLDHGGPDLAFILYAAALKLWLLGALLVGLLVPVHTGVLWIDTTSALAGMGILAVVTGLVESSMARLRLVHVPLLLTGAGVLVTLALILVVRGGS